MLANSFFSKFMLIFGVLMICLYIALGISLIFMTKFTYIPSEIRVIFGAFFIIYGIFRLVRFYYKYKGSKE